MSNLTVVLELEGWMTYKNGIYLEAKVYSLDSCLDKFKDRFAAAEQVAKTISLDIKENFKEPNNYHHLEGTLSVYYNTTESRILKSEYKAQLWYKPHQWKLQINRTSDMSIIFKHTEYPGQKTIDEELAELDKNLVYGHKPRK